MGIGKGKRTHHSSGAAAVGGAPPHYDKGALIIDWIGGKENGCKKENMGYYRLSGICSR